MPQSKQDLAVTAATTVTGFMTTFQALRRDVTEFLAKFNSEQYGATWNNFPTFAWKPDGTQGATDSTPNPANPTSVGGLNRSANALNAGVTLLQQFANLLDNIQAIRANYAQTIDDLVS